MSTDAPVAHKPRPSFLVPLLVLVIAGLIAWRANVFEKKPSLALVTSGDSAYWDIVIRGARDAAERYDVKLNVVKCKTDVDQQTQAIRDLLKTKYDGIAISPVNPNLQSALLADAASGSALVTVDSDSPLSRRLCFVGTDNYDAGRMMGEQIKRAIPDGGEVAICIGSPDKENSQHRRQGVIDELLDREYLPTRPIDPMDQPQTGTKYSVVATLIDNADPAKTTELVTQSLKDQPNIKCYVGLLSYSAPAILKSLEGAGKLGAVKIVGMDAAPETLAGIESGNIVASVLQDQYGFGFHAVRILAENARGETGGGLNLFSRRTLPCEVVQQSNVDAVMKQISAAEQSTKTQ